tara:strand:- start:118 stop:255 length:138 start_codon:yes stop_codon:yes gene_type:complete
LGAPADKLRAANRSFENTGGVRIFVRAQGQSFNKTQNMGRDQPKT